MGNLVKTGVLLAALTVLLGSLSGISISKLLIGGVVPGLLLSVAFIAYIIAREMGVDRKTVGRYLEAAEKLETATATVTDEVAGQVGRRVQSRPAPAPRRGRSRSRPRCRRCRGRPRRRGCRRNRTSPSGCRR